MTVHNDAWLIHANFMQCISIHDDPMLTDLPILAVNSSCRFLTDQAA